MALLAGLATVLVFAASSSASAAVLAPSGDANQVVQQASGQAGLVTGASFYSGSPSSAEAAGIGTTAAGQHIGRSFPTNGTTFAALTTGSVLSADPPNDSASTGTDNGTEGGGAFDVTSLRVELNVPAGHNCLTVDTAFYSEEFPEFVDSQFNDFFLATLDNESWSYDEATNSVNAPGNFAYDRKGSQLTINTTYTEPGDTGLEYDAGTDTLWARTPVTPGAHAITFTIADAGDGVWDSAAFIDNIRTENVPAKECKPGARPAEPPDDGDDGGGDGGLDHNCSAGGKQGKPYEVKAGPLAAVGCWTAQGDVVTAHQPVRINGIDLIPRDGATEISIDKSSYVISWNGWIDTKVGYLPLAELEPNQEWRGKKVVLSIESKGEPQGPEDLFSGKGSTIFGMKVEGGAELTFDGGKTTLKLSATMPELQNAILKRIAGFSGEIKVSATNKDGLVLDAAKLTFPAAKLAKIQIADAALEATRTAAGDYHFDGKITIYPFKLGTKPGFIGQLGFGPSDDYFKIGLGVENLNRHLGYGIFLQKVFAALQINPFGLTGTLGLTLGPQIQVLGDLYNALRGEGTLTYVESYDSDGDGKEEPWKLSYAGNMKLLTVVELQESKWAISGGKVEGETITRLKLAGYGFEGRASGWFTSKAFNLEGEQTISVPGPDAGGEAVLSSEGIGACRHGIGPDFGFGIAWDDMVPKPTGWGCDLGDWRAVPDASRPNASAKGGAKGPAPASLIVKQGTPRLDLRLVGESGAPQATFIAPDGTRYERAPDAEGATVTATSYMVEDQTNSATYFAVDNPAAGEWRIEIAPGSPAVSSVSRGDAFPKLRVRARVSGEGRSRALHYEIPKAAGRKVTFLEAGGASRRVIGSTKQASGTLRFRPAYGPGGLRRIVALPSYAGVAGASEVVARYRTKAVRPPRPTHVKVSNLPGHRRAITWRGARAFAYAVTVHTTDGRKLRYLRPQGSERRVVVDMVAEGVQVRPRVVAISVDGISSAPGRPGQEPEPQQPDQDEGDEDGEGEDGEDGEEPPTDPIFPEPCKVPDRC